MSEITAINRGPVGETDQEAIRIESRLRNEPLLRAVFAVFGKYIGTEISTKMASKLVAKRYEDPSTDRSRIKERYYEYLINMIPQFQEREYPRDFFDTFDKAGGIEGNEFHPNVALQFTVGLFDTYDREKGRHTGELTPRIYISAWGSVPTDGQSMLSPDTYLFHHSAYDRPYSKFCIYADRYSQEQLGNEIENALRVLTPNVLNGQKLVA